MKGVTNFNERPWGNSAVTLEDKYISVQDALEKSGLNFTVEVDKVYNSKGQEIPNSKVTYRTDTGHMFDVVGNKYRPLQNIDAFNWFESFIDAKEAYFETIGNLKDGKIVWVQAKPKIDPIEIVKGDPIESYILLSHSHDGTQAIKAGFTGVRMFCLNQMPLLNKSASSKLIKLKHTKNAVMSLEKVKEVMDIAKKEFVATTEQYKYLAKKAINKKQLEEYVKLIFLSEEQQEEEQNVNRTLERIEYYFENGRGNEKAKGTYWNALNAVTEFSTWSRGRSMDNRLQSLWFGSNALTIQKSLSVAIEMTK